MIFQAGNVRESASLFNLKLKKIMIRVNSRIRTHDLEDPVCYANLQTTEDL